MIFSVWDTKRSADTRFILLVEINFSLLKSHAQALKSTSAARAVETQVLWSPRNSLGVSPGTPVCGAGFIPGMCQCGSVDFCGTAAA